MSDFRPNGLRRKKKQGRSGEALWLLAPLRWNEWCGVKVGGVLWLGVCSSVPNGGVPWRLFVWNGN